MWVWVNTYRYILVGWTSISSYFEVHQRYQGFDSLPYHYCRDAHICVRAALRWNIVQLLTEGFILDQFTSGWMSFSIICSKEQRWPMADIGCINCVGASHVDQLRPVACWALTSTVRCGFWEPNCHETILYSKIWHDNQSEMTFLLATMFLSVDLACLDWIHVHGSLCCCLCWGWGYS